MLNSIKKVLANDPIAKAVGLVKPSKKRKSKKVKFTQAQKKVINKIKTKAYKNGKRASKKRY